METVLNTNENGLRSHKRTEEDTYFHPHVEWYIASNENGAKLTSLKICMLTFQTCQVMLVWKFCDKMNTE